MTRRHLPPHRAACWLMLVCAMGILACGPRVGPKNADFEHSHEVSFIARTTDEPEPLSAGEEVRELLLDQLPEGMRKRRSTQGIVADPRDPLNKKKMRRVTYAAVETAKAFPSIDAPHRVIGDVKVALRVRYMSFSADDEEIAAEEQALAAVALDAAKEEARKRGANTVVRVKSSMKPDGLWWRHPYREAFCRGERKRCVNHWVKFVVLHTSEAARVVPTAGQLLEQIAAPEHRVLPARTMKNGQFTLPLQRHHCYRLAIALEDDAKVPEGTNIFSVLSLNRVSRRVGIDSVFGRVHDVGNFGCAAKGGVHDLKVTAYEGTRAMTNNKIDPALFEGVTFSFRTRRMDPKEAVRHFCGRCEKHARQCGRRASCKPLVKCLTAYGMSTSVCREELQLR